MADEDKLNPLPVQATPGSRGEFEPVDPDNGASALIWALTIALAPLLCDAIFTEVIGGHPFYSVSLFHIGLGLFGLSLAALVRILGHGRGSSLIALLIIAAIVEVVIALYFGGTFNRDAVDRGEIDVDIVNLNSALAREDATPLSESSLVQLRTDLESVRSSHPPSSLSAYITFALFGLVSLLALIHYWSPPTESERRSRAA